MGYFKGEYKVKTDGRQDAGDPELQSGLVLHSSRFVCMQLLLLLLLLLPSNSLLINQKLRVTERL